MSEKPDQEKFAATTGLIQKDIYQNQTFGGKSPLKAE